MSGEWGPWIEHDGLGCHCIGKWVQAQRRSGRIVEGIAGSDCRARGYSPDSDESAWTHRYCPGFTGDWIIRYRIRKPRGLTILESLLENLPEQVDA